MRFRLHAITTRVFAQHHILLLCAIVLLGILLRFFHLDNYLWFQQGYDESRDMLVARHIVEYKERIFRGPLASGGMGHIVNSPLYYWLLALFWFLTPSVYGVAFLWMLLMSTVIALAYKAASNLAGTQTGLLAAFLIAIHPEFIFISRQVHLPYLLAPLVLAITILITENQTSLKAIGWATFFLFLGLNMHYAILLIVPAMILWLTVTWFRSRALHEDRTLLAAPIIFGVTCLEVWLLLTYQRVPFDQFQFFQFVAKGQVGQHAGNPAFRLFFELLWESDKARLIDGVAFLVLIFSGILFMRTYRSDKFSAYMWILVLCGSALGLGRFYNGSLVPSYLISILPLGIIISAVGLIALTKQIKWLGILTMAVAVVFFVSKTYYRERYESPSVSMYARTKDLALLLYRDASLREGEFTLAFLRANPTNPLNFWPTGSLYFTLEQLYGKPLVRLTDDGVNFAPLAANPGYLYIVCDWRLLAFDASLDTCNEWVRRAQENEGLGGSHLLYVENPYMLWRLEP